jgi:hypothetical protein
MRVWCDSKFFVRNLVVLTALLVAACFGVYESGVSAHATPPSAISVSR